MGASRMRDRSGVTMVEVIVAFLILAFAFGMLFQAIALSERILTRSREMRSGYRDLAGYYYLEGTAGGIISDEGLSRSERKTDLCFREADGSGDGLVVLEIPAVIREFRGRYGVLYDVTAEMQE